MKFHYCCSFWKNIFGYTCK